LFSCFGNVSAGHLGQFRGSSLAVRRQASQKSGNCCQLRYLCVSSQIVEPECRAALPGSLQVLPKDCPRTTQELPKRLSPGVPPDRPNMFVYTRHSREKVKNRSHLKAMPELGDWHWHWLARAGRKRLPPQKRSETAHPTCSSPKNQGSRHGGNSTSGYPRSCRLPPGRISVVTLVLPSPEHGGLCCPGPGKPTM
jgi:hypothetical protein